MINLPYKLDLIFKIINTNKSINKYNYNNNEINNKICIEKENLYKENLNSENKINKMDKTILDTELNLSENKLKSIIFNMGYNDIYWLISDKKSGFNFELKVTNKDRLNIENYNEYILSNGLLGQLKLNENSEVKQYINFDTNSLILQIIDWEINSIDEFINKWNNDKQKYNNNIPEIYFYGTIVDYKNDFLSYYYITKKYYNYLDIISKNNYNFTIDYFKKLLIMLDNIIGHNYIFRNLNMNSLGFELLENNNDFNIIILKYTNYTLLSLEDNYFNTFKITKCFNKKCIGNIIPYYIINDYYNLHKDWLKRLNKFYSLPLVEIILILFYNNDNNLTKLYDFIISPSILESQLQYFHFYRRFNSLNNIHNMNLMINNLNIRYCDINPILESTLSSIVINLLNKEYEKIYYPNNILEIIIEIEKSNNEFKINYIPKKKIYNSSDNYIKNIDSEIKQKIINDNINNISLYKKYKKYKTKYLQLINQINK
jgi:hypothetical protein